jgi:hypothetical protein
MIKRLFIYISLSGFIMGMAACNHNKIPCPTYADSQPEKKHKGKAGSQKPDIPKATKAKSGVLPTDGRGSRTHVPN